VLDYKSAHAPQEQPELVAQLRQYQSAVQTIYPGEVVKAAFLTPLGAVIEVAQGGDSISKCRINLEMELKGV
jgi:ATP-dependent helicase/nuclease subunit A